MSPPIVPVDNSKFTLKNFIHLLMELGGVHYAARGVMQWGFQSGSRYQPRREDEFGDSGTDLFPDSRIIRIVSEGWAYERFDEVKVEVAGVDRRIET